jgi:heptosyltransferase-3
VVHRGPLGPAISGNSLRFLVLRSGALGDILLTLPVLRALRESDASAFVDFIAPFPAALLARYGGAHSVSDLNSAAFLSLFTDDDGLGEPLRERLREVDCVICYLSDPERTVRVKIENCGCRFVPGPFRLDQRRSPAAVQLAQPLRVLGLEMIDPAPRLFLGRQCLPMRRFAFHVGSGSPAKNWPVAHWVALIARLQESFDQLLLISGEADEASTTDFLRQYQSSKLRIRSNLPVLEMANELVTADFFVGHDTGVTHLAAALGVPTVALFGPTDPVIWRPLGEHVTVIASEAATMEGLQFERVLHEVEGVLGG